MPVRKILPVAYHRQDTRYYCGAACAQMVLAQIGVGLPDQGELYDEIHSHSTTESGWATGPDGLTWTLNRHLPASSAESFELFALADEESLSRRIVWTIEHYGVAPVALVYGQQHWIIVRGYDANGAPTGADDRSYTISAFDVHIPWSYTPHPPAPHTAGDACGTGGGDGIANEHVTYSTWRNDYLTGVRRGHWAGKYLAVCASEPTRICRGTDRIINGRGKP